MSGSTLTAFVPIPENSDGTPGLWNSRFQALQDNVVSVNSVIPGPSVLSGSTWASIGLFANSSNSDYIRMVDPSGQRSTYILGSHVGGTADGLNIYDESGATMIVSFSKQSIRFFQQVVGPVFDVGGALSNTLNAATFGTGADSKETRIQAAILAAANSNISRVYLPSSLLPYSASSVSFIYSVQMTREGGNDAVYDAKAYGASGTSSGNDAPGIMSAWSSVLDQGGTLYIPGGTYKTAANLVWSVTGSTPKSCAVIGDAFSTIIRPTSAATIAVTLATEVNSDGNTNRLLVTGINFEGVETTGATGVLVGENAGNLSSGIFLEDVYVVRFQGTGSKGFDVRNVVQPILNRVAAIRCGTGAYVKGTDAAGALPTIVRFDNCQFRESGFNGTGTGRGIDLVQGYRVTFHEPWLEANRAEGFYCAPSSVTANVFDLIIQDAWFEVNHFGNPSNATLYQCKIDGTAGGTISGVLRDHNYVGTPKAVYLKACYNMVVDNVRPSQSTTSQIVIDTPCVGAILSHPENNAPLATVLLNNAPTTFAAIQPLWAPTHYVDQTTRDLLPVTSGAHNFGSATQKFKNLYLSNGLVAGTVSSSTLTTTGPISVSLSSAAVFSAGDVTTWAKLLTLNNPQAAVTGINMLTKYEGAGNVAGAAGVVQNASGVADFVWAGYDGSTYTQYARLLPSGLLAIGQVVLSNTSNQVFDPTNVATWTKYQVLNNLQTPATGINMLTKYEGAGNVAATDGVVQNPGGTADFVWAAYNGAAYSLFGRLHKDGLLLPNGSTTTAAFGFSSETSLGFYRSGASTVALSKGTFSAPELWATSGLSVGNTTAGGSLIPAISSTSSRIGAFVVQGSASSFTVVTWAAVQPGDQILTTIQPDTAVSSMSSGLVVWSHATKAGQFEMRLSNVSTLAQNQSSKTFYFTRITPF